MQKASHSPEPVVRIETRDLRTASSPEPSAPPETHGKRINVQLLSSAPPSVGMELIYDGNRDVMIVVDHDRKSYIDIHGWMRVVPASSFGERATKPGLSAGTVDLHGEGSDSLAQPVAGMVHFARFYQQAQQRLNQPQRLGGGPDDDDDDDDDKPPKDDQPPKEGETPEDDKPPKEGEPPKDDKPPKEDKPEDHELTPEEEEEIKKLFEELFQLIWEMLLDMEAGVYNGEEEEEEEEDDWDDDELELKPIRRREIDPSSFEPPSGYKRMSMGPQDDKKDDKEKEKDK